MKLEVLQRLCCSSCRSSFELNNPSIVQDSIETGFLSCRNCFISIPVLHGFPIFDEQFLVEPENLADISSRLFGTVEESLLFLDRKRRKPAYDLYAAFQPFNESTQAIFPLLPLLHEALKPGDLILDLWCRTGWTGEFLAAQFPEQHVLSLWENTGGLLGSRGFHFWLGSGKRRSNLDIIFHSPNLPLPFQSHLFPVVHGLDTLHRYRHSPLISECLRVATEEGILIFPHVHLTNSKPEPFFERGEAQLHGTDYEKYFEKVFRGTRKKVFVLSEKDLFDARSTYSLRSTPETKHFNATILLANQKNEGRTFERREKENSGFRDAYAVFNPLCKIDPALQSVRLAPEALGGGARELFYRHPIYQSRLEEHLPVTLEKEDFLILYWAERFKTVEEIATILNQKSEVVFQRMIALEAKEILQLHNISLSMAKLQHYYCHQKYEEEMTLSHLWSRTVSLYGDRPFLVWPEEESNFSYRDVDTVVRMAISFLQSLNLQKGDRVLIEAKFHPEFFFLFWAAVLQGCIAVPFNPELKKETLEAAISITQPAIIFVGAESETRISSLSRARRFIFGVNESSQSFHGSFSQLIGDCEPVTHFQPATTDQSAVVLFTSGSTGVPKAVLLSHGALFRSARILDQAYGWKTEDRFLGAGSFHTMSGLRNPCIAVLHSAASVVIPGKEDVENPLKLLTLCLRQEVTILNATPGFPAFWSRAPQKAKFFEGHKLRMFLSTGLSLHSSHRDLFESLFQCPIFDYYGLTETSGACILQDAELERNKQTGIGRLWNCLIKIVNDADETLPAGETGELSIYGDNLMQGYFGNPSLIKSRIRNGWFYTGDLARIQQSGCVTLLGRKDRMMIDKNGENIYPEEIERAIGSLPGVTEVFVTQYQDDLVINRIAAVVSVQSSNHHVNRGLEIKTALKNLLPDQHIPYLILIVQQLPRNPSGKVSIDAVNEVIRGHLK